MSLAALSLAAPHATSTRPTAVAQTPAAPAVRAVPQGTQARGFVLYVGVNEDAAAADGTSLGGIVEALKRLVSELSPSAESYAAVALAPDNAGGRDIDVVRLALREPGALAQQRQQEVEDADRAAAGVVIDISRKRVILDNHAVALTFTEFELLQFLVLREGRTVERREILESLWSPDGDEAAPNERTIDVHIRRLRGKLGAYEDIVRTVRGVGYRFDRHADVSIRHGLTPSPDLV